MDRKTWDAINGYSSKEESFQVVENNVVQVIKALLENGHAPDPLPELGMYTQLCDILANYIPKAPDREIREEMVKAARRKPGNEAFDILLRRGLDPQPEQQPIELAIIDEEITAPPLPCGMLAPELARGACPWLDDAYVPFSRTWSPRAPEIHHIGCGLWLLSTIAMRRLAAKEGRTVQPTPLYVQLVAPSSVWGKTTTARIAIDLLERLNLDWILSPNMVTPEKFLKNMATTTVPTNYATLDEQQKELVRLKIAHSGQRGWYYSEFGQLLREMADSKGRNALFKSILLRMDDCEQTSRYDTIGRDLEEIHLPYLTLLGTMTPDCMKPYSGSDASSWGDGFYARFAFCCVPLHRKKTLEDLEREQFPHGEGYFPAEIVQPLRDFHTQLKLHQCQIEAIEDENGGIEKYRAIRWPMSRYPVMVLPLHSSARKALNDYGNALALRAQDDDLAQFRSYYSRLRDKTLRIATLFAALQGCDCIEIRHIARAQQIAEEFRQSIHQLGAHLGQSGSASQQQEDKIIKVLRAKNMPLTARDITHYTNSDALNTQKRLDVLVREGEVCSTKQGRKTVYCIVHEEENEVE